MTPDSYARQCAETSSLVKFAVWKPEQDERAYRYGPETIGQEEHGYEKMRLYDNKNSDEIRINGSHPDFPPEDYIPSRIEGWRIVYSTRRETHFGVIRYLTDSNGVGWHIEIRKLGS